MESYWDVQIVLRDCLFLSRACHCPLFGVVLAGRSDCYVSGLDKENFMEALLACKSL
jgi:hypothetical protein